jgi:hypothetical protein
MHRRAFLTSALWFAGCSSLPRGLPIPALPKQHHVVLGQLVVHSDFPLPKQHRLLDELVSQRTIQAETLKLPATEESIHVYLFQTPEGFAAYIADRYPSFPARRAFFVETDTQLAVYAHWGDRVAEDLRHEVAHGYLHASVRDLPLWLDEGLAEYFEVPRGHRGMNLPHVVQLGGEMEQNSWRPRLQRLEALNSVSNMTQLDYAEAWAWAHFMLETTPERRAVLQGYLQAMRDDAEHTPPLSVAIRKLHFDPDQTLLEHIAAIQPEH